jgi:3-oxoacyl-[acyl-carrier-protein] synthase III
VAGVGTASDETPRQTLPLLKSAAEACLTDAGCDRHAIGLVLHAGIYRTEFLSEPALAALAANDLGINPEADATAEHQTLAFDVMNGGAGFLNACHTAAAMMGAGRSRNALVLASEVENNARCRPDHLLGLKETGSAVLLEESAADGEGFSAFLFRSFPEHVSRLKVYTVPRQGTLVLQRERDANLDAVYIECIVATVRELLAREGLRLEDVKAILPPHVSSEFVAKLADALGAGREKIVALPDAERDYFTSSVAYGFQAARERGLVQPGDVALVINVGAGIEVGCALYRF